MKAYCFSKQCIEVYLSKTSEKYIALCKKIDEHLLEYAKTRIKNRSPYFVKLGKEITRLKAQRSSMVQSQGNNNGAEKEGKFKRGDACPDCGWYLKVTDVIFRSRRF